MEYIYLGLDNIHEILKKGQCAIYGAGDLGITIGHFLENQGIHDYFYTVDESYWCKDMQCDGRDVLRFDDVLAKKWQIIYGLGLWDRLKEIEAQNILQSIFLVPDPYNTWKYDDDFMNTHAEEFSATEALFADEISREVMRGFLTAKRDNVCQRDLDNCFGKEKTYFNHLTRNMPQGAMVDCGAYTGDSCEVFLDFVPDGKLRKVFAFEPDSKNFDVLERKFRDNPNIQCIPKGVWNKEDILWFSSNGDYYSTFSDQSSGFSSPTEFENQKNVKVPVTTIDSVVGEEPIAVIKMDIEGSELKALQGAMNTIQRNHPILAISAYHRQDDLIVLPQYVQSFKWEDTCYDFYLRSHWPTVVDMVLYAIPRRLD